MLQRAGQIECAPSDEGASINDPSGGATHFTETDLGSASKALMSYALESRSEGLSACSAVAVETGAVP